MLDTHVLLWWVTNHPKMPGRYFDVLEKLEAEGAPIGLSIISLWEIVKLYERKKIALRLSLDGWFADLEDDPLVNLLPITPQIILESSSLGIDFPKDPADQLIVATARLLGLKLLTLDEKIKHSGVVLIA